MLPLLALKLLFHLLNWEIISIGPIITALVAGVFFVIAIILSGVLSDFKESEKIPSELAASIEGLYKDAKLITGTSMVKEMLAHVRDLTHTLITNFNRPKSWKLTEINLLIDRIDDDIRILNAGGAPIALVIKMRNEIGNIKRLSNRVEIIKEVSFMPAAQAIAEFATGSALFVFILLKIEPFYEGIILLLVVAAILISVILLIKDMDNPFEGIITTDLSQLHKLDRYLDSI